jgi:signal transduction histidine kinase
MDREMLNKVFKLFFSTKGAKGTGLGLMIVKKIIDEHKGLIEVFSEIERGTKFVVRLPEVKHQDERS